MQLVQKRKKVDNSTKRLLYWLGTVLGVLVIIVMWYAIGSINVTAKADNPTTSIETQIK